MRKITNIYVHVTATSTHQKVVRIMQYWSERLGWDNPGYHKIIDERGNCTTLLPDEQVANGVAGHNRTALHIAYIGGRKRSTEGDWHDTRTRDQKDRLRIELMKWRYLYPEATIKGHRDDNDTGKTCPNFDAAEEYSDI